LLFNEENEITEFIRANIVLDIDGQRVTPPVICGLLNGTLREALLASGVIKERVLTREDVARADKIWWVNGLRGEVLVQLN
jgi:para-aminobenzoate synthetase / 4-amino-4-deoxychorismate lyase